MSRYKKAQDRLNLRYPKGWTWTDAPISIYRNNKGEISTNFDASIYKHKGGVTYYVNTNGNNENDGLTPETALRVIHVARSKPDVGTIIVGEGYYDDTYGLNNMTVSNKSINIIAAEGEEVIISARRFRDFTKTEGYTNIYQTSRTLIASVYDTAVLDEYGDYTKLNEVADIATADATPGSYYYDGTVLYVHTVDSRPADRESVCIFLDVYNLYNSGNYRTYVEGIKFYGGRSGAVRINAESPTDETLFVAKNCEFKYATESSGGGLVIRGADAYLQNCIGAKNWADGFNYREEAGRKSRAIEVNCIGRHNGLGRGADSDNGSTTHSGCSIIRVNCEYFGNEGPNVHDIDDGTQSWNINCISHDSNGVNSTRQANFRSENGSKMWLDSCVSYNSREDLHVTSNATMRIRNTLQLVGRSTISGDLQEY